MIDAHGGVSRRMEDHERAPECRYRGEQLLCCGIVEEFAPDGELSTRKLDLGFAVRIDLGTGRLEEARHVRRVGGRVDGRHGGCVGDCTRRSENGSATETMADENGGRASLTLEP